MRIDKNGDESTPTVAFNFTYDPDPEEDLIFAHFNGALEPDENTSPLTPDEKQSLESYEQKIEAGVAGFYAVAKALHHIKTKKLYREEHSSFEAYCAEEHGFSRAHANTIHRSNTMNALINKILADCDVGQAKHIRWFDMKDLGYTSSGRNLDIAQYRLMELFREGSREVASFCFLVSLTTHAGCVIPKPFEEYYRVAHENVCRTNGSVANEAE